MAQEERLIKPEIEAIVVLKPEAYWNELIDSDIGEVITATCQVQVLALEISYEVQGWPTWQAGDVLYVFATE